MTGIEYDVVEPQDPAPHKFLLIRKLYRESPDRVKLLALYYVVAEDPPDGTGAERGTVSLLPSIHDVLDHNLVSSNIPLFPKPPCLALPQPNDCTSCLGQQMSLHYLTAALEGVSNQVVHSSSEGYSWKSNARDVQAKKAKAVSVHQNLVDDVAMLILPPR